MPGALDSRDQNLNCLLEGLIDAKHVGRLILSHVLLDHGDKKFRGFKKIPFLSLSFDLYVSSGPTVRQGDKVEFL